MVNKTNVTEKKRIVINDGTCLLSKQTAVNLSEEVQELFSRKCLKSEQEVQGDDNVYKGTTLEELEELIDRINTE